MKSSNRAFGGVILEIAIGLALLAPFYVAIVTIYQYMNAVSSVKQISAEASKRFDLKLLKKTAGVESNNLIIDPNVLTSSGNFAQYANTMGAEFEKFPKPAEAKLSINYMLKYISIDPESGAPDINDLNKITGPNFSPDSAIPRYAKGGHGELITQFLHELLISIKSNPKTPFQTAIPAGLRDIHQVSYLGASPSYSKNGTNENDFRVLNYFRVAPVVGISVVLDISETRTGKFISNFKNFVRVFSSSHSHEFNPRDDVTLIHETQMIVPRNVGL